MIIPDSCREQNLITSGLMCVVGVDEAGRGSLAGPVVACAVRFQPHCIPGAVRDSKTLGRSKLGKLAEEIRSECQYGIGQASVEEISQLNIEQASLIAMRRAIAELPVEPDHILVDGPKVPLGLKAQATPVIKGDRDIVSIAAASILAKYTRDNIMIELDALHPGFGWSVNAGYPTRDHLDQLGAQGPSPHHRPTFRPVQDALQRSLF